MPSYNSIVVSNQKIYNSPWFQRNITAKIPPVQDIDEEVSNLITSLVSDADNLRVPTSSAVYDFVLSKLRETVSDIAIIEDTENYFESPYIKDILYELYHKIRDLSNPIFNYKSSYARTVHEIYHNLNSEFISYNVFVKDEESNLYKNDNVPCVLIDNNLLKIESRTPINIKASILARDNVLNVTYNYKSNELKKLHIIDHNLNSEFITCDMFVKDEETNTYKNDSVSYSLLDNNTISVESHIPINIKAIISKL